MPLRIELRDRGTVIDGVEEWWDGVESVLADSDDRYPILDSISPYGDVTIGSDRLPDLEVESRDLARHATGDVRVLLLRIADLCQRAAAGTGAQLRFDGD